MITPTTRRDLVTQLLALAAFFAGAGPMAPAEAAEAEPEPEPELPWGLYRFFGIAEARPGGYPSGVRKSAVLVTDLFVDDDGHWWIGTCNSSLPAALPVHCVAKTRGAAGDPLPGHLGALWSAVLATGDTPETADSTYHLLNGLKRLHERF